MGLRGSKMITPEVKGSASAPVASATKEAAENGTVEPIPPIEQEANGECSTSPAKEEPAAEGDAQEPKAEESSPVPVEIPQAEPEIQVQSDPVEKVDQAIGHSDPAPPPSEPIVEVVPTTNGFHQQDGEEHFVEQPEEKVEESQPTEELQEKKPVEELAPEEPVGDLGLAEKLANLGIGAAENIEENGVILTNGDAPEDHDN